MLRFFKKSSKNDKELQAFILRTFGIRINNISLYKQAFIHKSFIREEKNAHFLSNERLEFLGDAVLDNVVAEYLYMEFPNKDEGYLTQLKSRMVNGAHLNDLGIKLGFQKFTKFQQFGTSTPKALYGDVMEALIGAMYIDKGFVKTRKAILEKIFIPNVNLKKMAVNDDDYKSQLIIWGQRKRKQLSFTLVKEKPGHKGKIFEIAVIIEGEEIARAEAGNKREAEKLASAKALKKLNSTHNKNK
ncbi:MAG TPA: ribonuclease III [Flavobacteriales bacterium]|nr:ribonuclease III [Flavobacteriales bacterium]